MNSVFSKYFECVNGYFPIKYIGEVSRVNGLLVESHGPQVQLGELCTIDADEGHVLAEVVAFQKDRIFLMPYSYVVESIRPGAKVIGSGSVLKVAVSDQLLGRVLNGIGQPIDGREEIFSSVYYSLHAECPSPLEREQINVPFSTGVKVVDGMCTVGEGQRMGVFSGTGVGKSTMLGMIARHSSADVNVAVLIGERGREVLDFIEKDLGHDGLRRTVLIVATADSSALMRIKAAFVGTAIAEYFRDQGKSVVLMMDSVTRFARAQRELGLAIGEPPTTRGYPPSVFALIPQLLERAGKTRKGCITGFYSVLVEGDDMNEPISDNVRGILDGHIILSRALADQRYYPAVDIPASLSRLAVNMLSSECLQVMGKIAEIIAVYKESEDLILIGAYMKGSNPKVDYALKMIEGVRELFKQEIDEYTALEDTFALMFELFSTIFDVQKCLPTYYAKTLAFHEE